MFRRINLYAGPGAGKSAGAANLFSAFKVISYKCEQVTELAKKWAYEGRTVRSASDQFLMFATQKWEENLFLMGGANFIVTDSPLLLPITYSKYYGFPEDVPGMHLVEQAFEDKYPSLNIVLRKDRSSTIYNPDGRFQKEQEAAILDGLIEDDLKATGRSYVEFPFHDTGGMFNFIKKEMDK